MASSTSRNWIEEFVKDPEEVVAVGDIVRVKVLSADPERKRVALSRRQAEGGG